MKTLEGATMPQVRSSKNRSLVIKADIGQELGIDPSKTFTITKEGEQLILTPTVDPLKAKIDAAIDEGLKDFEEGRCSPVFDNMDDAIAWLNSNDE